MLGQDPWRDPVPVRQRLGWVAQETPLFEMRLDRLLWHLSGLYPTWDPQLVEELVHRFQLDLTRTPSALSKGEGVRLRLMLALAFRPTLLVLDEPTAGLDLWGRPDLLAAGRIVTDAPTADLVPPGHTLEGVLTTARGRGA